MQAPVLGLQLSVYKVKCIIELVIGIVRVTDDYFKEHSDELMNSEPDYSVFKTMLLNKNYLCALFMWITLAERFPNFCFTCGTDLA